MHMLYKNTLVKIKKSFGRFISLFIIVLVGVGFFAGLQATAPDIAASISKYYNDHKLMDYKIVSTMGLTDEDVAAVRSLQNVRSVIPSYSLDVLDQGNAIRIHAIEPSVNTVILTAGRMPESDTECIADEKKYAPSDKIIITSDVSDQLKNREFTVVGTIRSPLYLAYDYGNTNIGSGTLTSFVFVNRSNFVTEAYTEIYVQADGTANISSYDKEYDTLTSSLNGTLKTIQTERETARYQEIYNKASDEIAQNLTKLNTQTADSEKQLADAKAQLDTNQEKLSRAKAELNQNQINLQEKIQTQNASFQSAQDQIQSGQNQISAALQQNGLTQEELPAKISELNSAISALQKQQDSISSDNPKQAQLTTQISQYTASYQQLVKLQASIDALNKQEDQLNQGIAAFHEKIAAAKKQLADGETTLSKSQKELDNGYTKYNDNLSTFTVKISDAQAKIKDAQNELADLKQPQWTILGRDTAVAGHTNIKSGSEVIVSVSRFFPLFFILIVLLMTSNTMARMVEEERGEIGTLASLGFSNRKIISTYLFYVLSATVSGALLGYYIGCTMIPRIIYSCFPFILPPLIIQYSLLTFLLILAVAAIIMTTVTVLFCNRELQGTPATLMRPVPPKSGQTILLEKMNLIWKHLSFTWKITMRNLFRYKQRVAMTIIGIAGCTALLLTGFGVKDSISGVSQTQYGEIFRYSDLLVLKNDVTDISGNLDNLLKKESVLNPLLISQSAFTFESGKKTLDAYLIVPENEKIFSDYFQLKDTLDKTNLALGDSGVIVSQNLAGSFQLKKGDSIRITDSGNKIYELPVTGITENHIQNYIYMSKNLYRKTFDKPASFNIIVSDYSGNQKTLAENLLKSGLIVNVNFREDMLKQAESLNKGLNSVVILLVCVASLLMVIVLYNLTSINISERKREIATLKVLGFNDTETNAYIYRETVILTLLSIGIGLILGTFVHHLIMNMINGNTPILFFVQIKKISFLYTFLIAIAVSVIMQVVTYFKLQTIDMIESLKSVE